MPKNHRRRMVARASISLVAASALGAGVAVAATGGVHAGPQGDGTAMTPVGYRITPAGQQTPLGDLPLAVRPSPSGDMLLVSNDGQGTQSLQVVDPHSSKVVQTIPYKSPQSLFAGLAFSPKGDTAYASGGGDEQIHTYAVSGGKLTEGAPIAMPTTNPSGAKVNMFPAGLEATGDGTRLVVADHLADAASVVNPATKAVNTVAVGHNPLGVAVTPDGSTAFVTNQGANTVSVLDISKPMPSVRDTITVGTHPNAETLDAAAHRLYVANGDSDAVSVVDTASDKVVGTIDLAPYSHANVGSNPTGLSLSPDHRLYVANSGNNDVDVVDLGSDHVVGSIPTAWYPSAVAVTGGKLFTTNGKGLGAGPNDGPGYPNPTSSAPTNPAEYVGSMMVGSLSTVSLPLSSSELAHDTNQVRANDGFDGANSEERSRQPIQHVIYVVKENRTYDQEFGSLGKGNGDPQLNLFGEESATNSRALQRRFVTLDNFYADAEVSAQGWNSAVAANSNPFSEALWPADYSGRNAPYPSESADPAIAPNRDPAHSYIWQQLADAHVSFRNYGFYVNNQGGQFNAGDPVLNANTDHNYRGFDLSCPSNPDTFKPLVPTCGTPRSTEWQSEFNQYVKNNNLPTVELLRMPNDHNAGTTPGAPTPRAYTADDDLQLGRMVDAVSHSPYWKNTAIFVTEDDAQNGPDHVDAHRTISQVISPYTQTGKVDSSFYSTASMLRTMENITGIKPLTQFDAFATPMTASFTNKPDDSAYTAVKPSQAGNILNSPNAPMAAASAAQPLQTEDQINMQVFNQAIWESVKGANSPMPAPRHGLPSTPSSTKANADSDG